MTPEEIYELNKQSSIDNANSPAYPHKLDVYGFKGLTKREYVATKVLSGLLAEGKYIDENVVEKAIELTDSLLIGLSSKLIK